MYISSVPVLILLDSSPISLPPSNFSIYIQHSLMKVIYDITKRKYFIKQLLSAKERKRFALWFGSQLKVENTANTIQGLGCKYCNFIVFSKICITEENFLGLFRLILESCTKPESKAFWLVCFWFLSNFWHCLSVRFRTRTRAFEPPMMMNQP